MTFDVQNYRNSYYNNRRRRLGRRNSMNLAYTIQHNLSKFVIDDLKLWQYFSKRKRTTNNNFFFCSFRIVFELTTQTVCATVHVTCWTCDDELSCGSGQGSHRQHCNCAEPWMWIDFLFSFVFWKNKIKCSNTETKRKDCQKRANH